MAFGGGIAVRVSSAILPITIGPDTPECRRQYGFGSARRSSSATSAASLINRMQRRSFVDDTVITMDFDQLNQLLADQCDERDSMWRTHERAQINFLQKDHSTMLTHLHREIERLQHVCRDLESRLTLSPTISEDDIDDLKRRLADAECEIEQLHGQLQTKDVKIGVLEAQLDKAMRLFRDQLGFQADHIRQLNRELHERTATVTQLSTQLRTVRLKSAMIQAQERRRATCGDSPKRVMPSIATVSSSSSPFSNDLKSYQRSGSISSTASLPPIDNIQVGSIEKSFSTNNYRRNRPPMRAAHCSTTTTTTSTSSVSSLSRAGGDD